MRRLAVAVVVVGLVVQFAACGGTVVVGGRMDFPVVSGTVSIVHLTIIDGNVHVTTVTLINSGSAQTVNFCGNVVSHFPSNSFVTVTYSQGTSCNTIVKTG